MKCSGDISERVPGGMLLCPITGNDSLFFMYVVHRTVCPTILFFNSLSYIHHIVCDLLSYTLFLSLDFFFLLSVFSLILCFLGTQMRINTDRSALETQHSPPSFCLSKEQLNVSLRWDLRRLVMYKQI